tara:strand:+ start:1845 stop:2156 length:312 start_codon:yes stop_codon:yes gene_type:complete
MRRKKIAKICTEINKSIDKLEKKYKQPFVKLEAEAKDAYNYDSYMPYYREIAYIDGLKKALELMGCVIVWDGVQDVIKDAVQVKHLTNAELDKVADILDKGGY